MSEAKEFDEVLKPKEKKKKQELETFSPPEEKKEGSEWNDFFQSENEKYAKTVKVQADKTVYPLPIMNGDGASVKTVFARRQLSVGELRKLNALQKEYNEKPKEENSLFQAESLASLYQEFADLLLVNKSTNQRMTKEEFEQQDWAEIRSILDNCILKSIIGSSG